MLYLYMSLDGIAPLQDREDRIHRVHLRGRPDCHNNTYRLVYQVSTCLIGCLYRDITDDDTIAFGLQAVSESASLPLGK